jgi:hypothetical protein
MGAALTPDMRNISTVALSGLVVAALGGLAHAEHRASPTVASARGNARVATSEAPRLTRAQLTGELRIAAPVAAPVADPVPAPAAVPATRIAAFLDAGDVTSRVAPHAAELERCYLTHISDARDAGHLDVLFEIGRDGHVRSIATAAGGLSPAATRQVTSCIQAIARSVQFPTRRNDTTVVLPYYFQKTEAPNAGPQLSCWSPQGCHQDGS